jgi:hypothetical protein
MLKVIKWEFLKRSQNLKFFYIILLGIVLINILLPVNFVKNNVMVSAISSIYGVMLFAFICIYSIVAITSELRSSHAYLEKTITKKPWEILGGKLINNFIYLIILYATILILAGLINRVSTETNSYMEVNVPFYTMLIIGLFLPLTVYFFYLLSKSITFTRNMPILATTIMICTISILITRILDVPFIYEIMKDNTMLEIVLFLVISIGLFLGSCRLYEKYYEI